MDGKHILIIILMIKDTQTFVLYSKTARNYTDAVSECANYGGQFMRYGQAFVNGLLDCGQSNTSVNILTGIPHYNESGCTTSQADNQSQQIANIHFAMCADFCESDDYSYVGITNTTCACYRMKPVIASKCSKTVQCPGNALDKCGVQQHFVFEKVNTTSCRFRIFFRVPGNSQDNNLDEDHCSYYKYNFFCKVGNDSKVTCGEYSDTNTVSVDIYQSTQETPTSMTVEGNTSSTVTETTSFELVTNREHIPENERQNIGLIIGVAVAAVLLLTVIIIIIFRRVRTNKSFSNGTKPEKAANMTDVSRENQQSLMYDSASFRNTAFTHDNPDNGVYDSAAQNKDKTKMNKTEQDYGCLSKPEGVYDSAIQNQKEHQKSTRKDDLHIYDYRGTTEGLYDSASNQQVLQKPHSEESEYGCAVRPEGIYDAAGAQSLMTSSHHSDNIYDHNSDLIYVTNENKSGSDGTDIYDHT